MTFAQPLWLLLAPLALLIVALHMRRRRIVRFPSLLLWQHLSEQATAAPRLRPPAFSIPLVMQVTAFLLIVLALARPVTLGTASEPVHHVVLVDTSGSMQAKDGDTTRQQRVVERLGQMVDDLERGTRRNAGRVSVITVGPDVRVLASRRPVDRLEPDVEQEVEPSAGSAPWVEAASIARSLIRNGESAAIVVLTDAAGREPASRALSAELAAGTVEVLEFGRSVENLGFGWTSLEPIDGSRDTWRLVGDILNFTDGADATTVRVEFTPEDAEGSLPWAEHRVELVQETTRFELELELDEPGTVELFLPDDGIEHDNFAYLKASASPPMARIVRVGPTNDALDRALMAIDGVQLFHATAVPEDDEGFDLIIMDRVAASRLPSTNTMWLGGARVGETASPSIGRVSATDWDAGHPISQSVEWSELEDVPAYLMSPRDGAAVVVTSPEGPLVQTRTTLAGREIYAALDVTSMPEWTASVAFPAWVSNVVRWAVPRLVWPETQTCSVGATCELDPSAFAADASFSAILGAAPAYRPQLAAPGGGVNRADASPWLPQIVAEQFAPRMPGVLESGTGESVVIVALASNEADVREGAGGSPQSPEVGRRRALPWPAILAALSATLILIDTLIAWRSGEGILRPRIPSRAQPHFTRQIVILSLAGLAVAAIAAAASDVRLPWIRSAQSMVVVADQSAWLSPMDQNLVNTLLQSAGTDVMHDRVVRIAGTASEPLDATGAELPGIGVSNLDQALRVSAGMLAGAGGGRIVLAADTSTTLANIGPTLARLVEEDVTVDVLPLNSVPEAEIWVSDVHIPDRVYEGSTFTLDTRVHSRRAADARVRYLRNGVVIEQQTVMLHAGVTRLSHAIQAEQPGSVLYEIEVESGADTMQHNNRSGVVAQVSESPNVLLVAAETDWAETLLDALAAQEIDARLGEPEDLPVEAEGLLDYDVVVMSNVRATELHTVQQEALKQWVRNFGGGVILLGGENSFGPGGYLRTPLEEISPLSSRIEGEAPQVALMFVLDRSGSMLQNEGFVSRMSIAKEATLGAARLLHEESQVGVIVFDSAATTLFPMQSATGIDALERSLGRLEASGGTSIYPALVNAVAEFQDVEASSKHIVLMSDGLSEPGDFESIVDQLADLAVTVSTVAIGGGADAALLGRIAEFGDGAFHATEDFRALPSILAQEALLLSGTPVETGNFAVNWANRSAEFLNGIPDVLPSLGGYVRTSAQDGATVHLSGPDEIPLLASWRTGLGRVIAFASHGTGPWTSNWIGTDAHSTLWPQAVRWVVAPVARSGVHVEAHVRAGRLLVRASVVGADGSPSTRLRVVGWTRSARQAESAAGGATAAAKDSDVVLMQEVRPGVYEAFLPVEGAGQLEVVVETSAEPPAHRATHDMHLGYPASAFSDGRAQDLLAVAATTGGSEVRAERLTRLLRPGWTIRWSPNWPFWLLLAIVMLMAQLTMRYAPRLLRIRNQGLRRVSLASSTEAR